MPKKPATLLSQEAVMALASSALPDRFMAGDTVVPFEEFVDIAVSRVWALCGEDEGPFFQFIDSAAGATATFNGVPSNQAIEHLPVIRATVMAALEADPTASIALLVNNAVKSIKPFAPLPAATVSAWNAARKGGDTSTLCHAPSANLYFARDGSVGVCCYSRLNPVGRMPAQTIAEIWSGEKIRAVRERLAESIMPGGCEICAEQILAHNFAGLMAANFEDFAPQAIVQSDPAQSPAQPSQFSLVALLAPFKREKATPSAVQSIPQPVQPAPIYPRQMEFELSNKCNLECDMCSGYFSSSIRANRDNKPPLPMVYDAGFVEQLREFVPHLKRAKFLGGEPFLIDIYYDIWELFIELNPSCEISITTNANVFTARAQRIVERLNCNITVSFDSITKPIYESIRVNANFERTLQNLETLRDINRKKNKPTAIAVCPMISNAHEIPEIVAFANQRELTVYFNTVINPWELSLKYLPVEKQLEIVKLYRASVMPAANGLESENWKCLEGLANQLEAWSSQQCNAPQEGLVVLA